MLTFFAACSPDIRGNSNFKSQGAYIERFEHEFADLCFARNCVAASYFMVAIHLAFKILNVGRGRCGDRPCRSDASDYRCLTKRLDLGVTSLVNWTTLVSLDGGSREERDAVNGLLNQEGIDARRLFYPLSAYPMFARASCPVFGDLSARCMNLLTYQGRPEADIERICQTLLGLVRK
jgi:dTDP-4-amino-4,6-dideoxygalactose transaminase